MNKSDVDRLNNVLAGMRRISEEWSKYEYSFQMMLSLWYTLGRLELNGKRKTSNSSS